MGVVKTNTTPHHTPQERTVYTRTELVNHLCSLFPTHPQTVLEWFKRREGNQPEWFWFEFTPTRVEQEFREWLERNQKTKK
jgi:hypothetical protein